jgi:zinc/manganese transport system ATP-binding protein
MTRPAAAAIRFHDLTLGYDRHPAVHHLSGELAPGSLTAIVGPNGSGKSTLLKGIVGALRPLGGRIETGGLAASDIAYLPQQSLLDRGFPLETGDLVALGLWRRLGMFRGIRGADLARVETALAAVGLDGFERRPIGSLSGGQLQRALFARVLVQDAPVILLDEPLTAIDARTAADLLALLHRWHGERRTVVAVLHELEQVRAHFPDTLLLAREPIQWGRTQDVLTPANLLRARRHIEARDDAAAPCERLSA